MSIHFDVPDPSSNNPAAIRNILAGSTEAVQKSNAAVQAARARNYDLAASLHQEALDIKLRAYGEQSEQAAISFNGLGENLLRAGRIQEAEEALSRALRVRDEAQFGGLGIGPRFDAAVTRENMAQLREAQGSFLEAREMRLRGKDNGEMACGNEDCPGQMYTFNQVKACGGCKCVFYCTSQCQKKDWSSRHKSLCQQHGASSKAYLPAAA